MKRSELKTGMIIENAEGNLGKVLRGCGGGILYNDIIAGGSPLTQVTWFPLYCLSDNLADKANEDIYDIVNVWAMDSNMHGASLDVKGKLLWSKPKPVVMKLTDTYDAEVSADFKTIRVGCQTIKVDTVRDLLREIDNTKD